MGRKGERRQETGNSFAEIGLATWDLGFFSFSGSWRTWRFNLPRPRKIRLRIVIGHWSLVKRLRKEVEKREWSLVIGH